MEKVEGERVRHRRGRVTCIKRALNTDRESEWHSHLHWAFDMWELSMSVQLQYIGIPPCAQCLQIVVRPFKHGFEEAVISITDRANLSPIPDRICYILDSILPVTNPDLTLLCETVRSFLEQASTCLKFPPVC